MAGLIEVIIDLILKAADDSYVEDRKIRSPTLGGILGLDAFFPPPGKGGVANTMKIKEHVPV